MPQRYTYTIKPVSNWRMYSCTVHDNARLSRRAERNITMHFYTREAAEEWANDKIHELTIDDNAIYDDPMTQAIGDFI